MGPMRHDFKNSGPVFATTHFLNMHGQLECLRVPQHRFGQANGLACHAERLTNAAMRDVSQNHLKVIFLLWGKMPWPRPLIYKHD